MPDAYLTDIDKQARERFERLIEDMKLAQGITEQVKAANVLEWIGRLKNTGVRGQGDRP